MQYLFHLSDFEKCLNFSAIYDNVLKKNPECNANDIGMEQWNPYSPFVIVSNGAEKLVLKWGCALSKHLLISDEQQDVPRP
jgi:hypothetical protein